MKLLTCSGFDHEVLLVDFMPKSFLGDAHLVVCIKKGLLGERVKFKKDDIAEVEIVDEEQTSSEGSQRLKNAAIGVVLLGPIGLLGAAMGKAKKSLKIRFVMKSSQQLVIEIPQKEASKLYTELLGINLDSQENQKYLKTG